MKAPNRTKRFVRKAAVCTNPKMDEAILKAVLTAHDEATEKRAAQKDPGGRKIRVKGPIVRLAAVVVMVVGASLAGIYHLSNQRSGNLKGFQEEPTWARGGADSLNERSGPGGRGAFEPAFSKDDTSTRQRQEPLTANFVEAAAEIDTSKHTIDEWIERLGSKGKECKEAKEALIEIGLPAVPAMMALIERRDQRTPEALYVLGGNAAVAREVTARLRKIAKDQAWSEPTWIPFDLAIAENRAEEQRVRALAVDELGKIGMPALDALRKLLHCGEESIAVNAQYALVDLFEKENPEAGVQFFAEQIEADLFDYYVPDHLSRIEQLGGYRRAHSLREKAKQAYRRRLQETPDLVVAKTLAHMIQGQLGSRIVWETHTDWVMGRGGRECPSESFATLARVLEYVFEHAEKDSDSWREFGTGLAKLRLLQGDWEGMNAMLAKLGWTTIPAKDRSRLCVPPDEWGPDLRSRWGFAGLSMRSGTCSLVFHITKGDGTGIRGVHVIVCAAPKPEPGGRRGGFNDGSRGMSFGTFASEPLNESFFDWSDDDRPKARYAVSDVSGQIRFDKLPAIPVKIAVMIVTSNFPEAAKDWDLWMEVAPGRFRRARQARGADFVTPHDPLAAVKLEPGKVVHYPRFVVRPRYELNVKSWTAIDKDNVVLDWERPKARAGAKIRYELELSLTYPWEDLGGIEDMPMIRLATEITQDTTWPVSEKGVGGMRLHPGNMYLFDVRARDERGTTLARWGKVFVWAPWEHRKSRQPIGMTHDSTDMPTGSRPKSPEEIDQWLQENASAFECEYVRVLEAWVDWREGDRAKAREQLIRIIKELPKGNLAHSTALWLLGEIDAGQQPPRRLSYVPFNELDPNRISAIEQKLGVRLR